VERYTALARIDTCCVDDALEHCPLRVGDLSVQYLQVAGLGMPTVSEDVTERPQIFRPAVGAGEHYDRANSRQFFSAPFVQHPNEKTLQDKSTLAVRDDRNI